MRALLLLFLLIGELAAAGLAARHVTLANAYLRRGRVKDARMEAEVARKLEPQNAEVVALWQRLDGGAEGAVAMQAEPTPNAFLGARLEGPLARARVAYKESRLAEAKSAWEQVLLLAPGQAEAEGGLASLKREAYHADADQPFDKAVQDLFDAGWRDLRKGRHAEGRKKFQEALTLNPDQADVKAALGQASKRARQEDGIKDAQALLAQAQSYAADGEDVKAAQSFSAALAASPELKEAQEGLAQVTARNKDKVQALLVEADRALAQGQWKKAQLNYEKALALSPGNDKAESGLRSAQASLGGERARAGQRAEADRLYNLGVEAWQAGRLSEAATQFRACLAVDKDDAEATKALEALRKKLDERADKDHQDAKALLQEGKTLEERGAWDEAVKRYQRAAAKDPGLAEAETAGQRLQARMKGI